MKKAPTIRVLPVVLVAVFGLAVLKIAGIFIDGGYVFDYQPSTTKKSWAQETFNFPSGNRVQAADDITGSVEPKPKDAHGSGSARSRQARPRRLAA